MSSWTGPRATPLTPTDRAAGAASGGPGRTAYCPGCLRRVGVGASGILEAHDSNVHSEVACYGSLRSQADVVRMVAFGDEWGGRKPYTVERGAGLVEEAADVVKALHAARHGGDCGEGCAIVEDVAAVFEVVLLRMSKRPA